MHVTVTITRDTQVNELRALIEAIRERIGVASITVQEAPTGIEYAYPFPMVAIKEPAGITRQFGAEAVDYLRSIAEHHAAH